MLQQIVKASLLHYKKAVQLLVCGTAVVFLFEESCLINLAACAACAGWEEGTVTVIAAITKALLEQYDGTSC